MLSLTFCQTFVVQLLQWQSHRYKVVPHFLYYHSWCESLSISKGLFSAGRRYIEKGTLVIDPVPSTFHVAAAFKLWLQKSMSRTRPSTNSLSLNQSGFPKMVGSIARYGFHEKILQRRFIIKIQSSTSPYSTTALHSGSRKWFYHLEWHLHHQPQNNQRSGRFGGQDLILLFLVYDS